MKMSELKAQILAKPLVAIGHFHYDSQMIVDVFDEMRVKAKMVELGMDGKDKMTSLLTEILLAELGVDDD